ncbi:MAG: VCBS repeat-containing protein [Pirellulales bacterium]|nr:VCBS repeat-containing protein [Pirellulales bacterium]
MRNNFRLAVVLMVLVGCRESAPSPQKAERTSAGTSTSTGADPAKDIDVALPPVEPPVVPGGAASPHQAANSTLPKHHLRMLAELKDIRTQSQGENRYVGHTSVKRLRDQAANTLASAPAADRWKVHFALGKAELKLGYERPAIDAFSECVNIAASLQGRVPEKAQLQLLFELGVAYLRHGETQNCCRRNTPDSCIVPIRGEAIHTQQEGSQNAIKCFTQIVQRTERLSLMHLKARWLLNIAYMTIGRYPDDVPAAYVIPASLLTSDESFPRFTNISKGLGLGTFSLSGGAILDDFNGDNYLDLAVSTFDPAGQLRHFRNNQDGTFRDATAESQLEGVFGGLNLVQADYDNDGDVDILVLRGAWLFEHGQHPNSLLQNNGDGTFVDVTFAVGLGDVHYPTQTAGWADYDNDGDLDLYIGNETTTEINAPCQLFRNDGNAANPRFVDVAAQAGVSNGRFTKGVVWGDYNEDRFPDLYVSNLRGQNRLYRNQGDGTFVDVATELNVTDPAISFPAWFWDFDNDGRLDIYVAAYNASIANVAAHHLGIGSDAQRACLYRGNGNGFDNVAAEYGLTQATFPMGANFGDLDNDGFLDFYLGTGDIRISEQAPNIMYRNQQGRGFADITMSGGFGHLQKGHAVVFADWDNDGDQDVFEQLGGAYPCDRFHDALFENPGFGNHWISIKLVGVTSNRSAIGAKIRLEVVDDGERRTIYKHVNSGGSFGANPLQQAIGVAAAERIEQLEVYWPTTGQTQSFTDVGVNQTIQIVEGQDQYTTIPLKAVPYSRPTNN